MEMNGNNTCSLEPDAVTLDPCSDENLAVVCFHETETQPERYLVMTLDLDSLEFYLELNDQSLACYDCLADTTFFSEGVVIHLKPAASDSLDGVDTIAIRLGRLSADQATDVRRMLATTFAGAMRPTPSFSSE